MFPDWATWLASLGVDNADLRIRHFSDANLVIEAAASGLGVTLAWYSLVADDLKAGRLVRVLDQGIPSTLGYDLVIPKNRVGLGKVAAFRAWLLEQGASQTG
jgi:LysR family transcriptional regulator, glycine cleavage system transcriptional activator